MLSQDISQNAAARDPQSEAPAPVAVTSSEQLSIKVERVASRKDDWLAVTLASRIVYLRRALDGVVAVAERWVEDGCRLKGISPGSPLAGEEWVAGPAATARNIRLLIHALDHGGQPPPRAVRARKDGQLVAKVFPLGIHDRLLFTGFDAEVWISPGKPATQGQIYRASAAERVGKVALVLGGGNVSSIPPMDLLYKLFVENEVVILKMNPVNAYLGAYIEEAFRSLIDDGFLAVIYGGADVGARLAEDPRIGTLHVTGSDRTYDAIVWGADPGEQARRKQANDPKNSRPFSAELGCVTPILVVPGPWSAADMDFQARQVASMVAQNASFNCNAAKVLVTAKGWLQRDVFLEKVARVLSETPARKAYYPGAQDRYRKFIEHYSKARVVGPPAEGAVPWTVIPDVPSDVGEYALSHEAFCGVLAEVTLDATHPDEFLSRGVDFANERCWGTLSCGVLVHPATMRDYPDAMDTAIANLRYGGIGINCWPAVVYALGTTTWGAFPGHDARDIRSGVGVVHNALLFDHPQKSVVRAPFRIRPTPAWFADNKNLAETGRRLTRYEQTPSWANLMSVAAAALRG